MRNVVFASAVGAAALAGLMFGFDTAVVSGVTHDVQRLFNLTPAALGVTVSSALWGTLIGALFAGAPGDRFGSRDTLRVMAVFYIISGLGSALAWDWSSLLVSRFIGGLAIGGSSVLAPVYLSEISPAKRRGALVGLFQLNIVIGILVAYLSNFIVGQFDLGAAEWRWKFGVTVLPAMLLFVALFFIPNSPRWLAARGRHDAAKAVLDAIGIDELHAPPADADKGKLTLKAHAKPILLAVLIATFNQFAGINAILYYLNDIFAAAGYGQVSADMQAVAIGATNLLFTLLAMTVIDRLGRKTLLLIGAVGMTAALSTAALVMFGVLAQSLLLWVLVAFIAFFAFSQGAVIWVYIAEIFPTPVRARGQSIGSGTHWLWNAAIALVYPSIAAMSKGLPFVFFAAMMAIQFVVVLFVFPETKGASLEELEKKLTV
ncbi:MAG: sugar porter family MFS transporter [Pseudomonadota bacterium]